jgi:hypothetical protein
MQTWRGRKGIAPDPSSAAVLRTKPRPFPIFRSLTARIAEAEREGWTGEAEGLRVSLAVTLGMPAYRDVAGRTADISPRTVQR